MKASSSITLSHITDGLTTHYQYAKNESNITAPSVGWSATVPTSEAGKFIWRREGHALTGETPSTWSTPVCLTGAKGDQGTKGEIKDYPIIPQFTWKGKGSTPENLVSFEWSSSGNYPSGLENPTIDSTASGTAGGYWNNASGQPLDIGIKAHDDFELEEVRVRIVSGYGSPSMKVMYHNGSNWILLQTFTATGDSTVKTYTITSPVKAKWWKILFENNNWTGLSNLRVIGTLHSVIGPSGEVGSPGEKGEPGVPGSPGEQGEPGADYGESAPYVYAEGNTIYVEGGYFYYNQVKVEVPNFSLALTGTGGGYVLASDSEVVIAKMLPEQGYVKWAHYNTLENVSGLFIIGRFDRGGGGITNINQVSPIHPSQFTKSHFMELLADGGYADMTVWADALGVTQVFESLAVWDLFANKLNVNTLEIEKMVAGKLFRLLLTASEGANYPLVEAYRGSELVFQINAEDGSVFINGTGNFSGTIKHEALETSAYAAGSPISLTPTASLWSGASLYNSLSEGGVKSATGTGVNGKSVNCYAKLTNPAYVQCGSNTDRFQVGASWVSKSHSIPLLTTIVDFQLSVPKLPQAPPISFEIYKTSGGVETKLKSGAIPQGSSITFSFEYKYGDSVRIACRGAVGFSLSLIYVLTYRTSASYTKGILIGYTDNTVTHVKHDGYYDHPIILTSPSWNYGSYISYRKGDPLSSHSVVTALSIGLVFPATGSATIYPAGGSSTTYTVIGIRRDSNGTSLVTTVGEVSILKWGGNGTAIGVFNSYTVSISMVGQQRAIMVSSMLPKSNGDGKDLHTVGSSSSKFLTGYFVTLYSDLIGNVTGQVNDAGTSNKVYGAVFN